ncbi:MAG: ferrous iron transport protein A [Bacteroidetes bacterium]|nr:ferrous iron transport protein A [Bacteroidota bacterium]
MGTRSLDQLIIGESAIIRSLDPDSSSSLKLMELGFTPGQEVTVISKALLQDPIAIALRGTIIAIRRREASCIRI